MIKKISPFDDYGSIYYVAILGGTEATYQFIDNASHEHFNKKVFVHYYGVNDVKDKKFLLYDYDIFIVNSIENISVFELIGVIKEKHPLAEVILISVNENYQMAINAFREGVRDILQYPIDLDELLVSLDKSFSYRFLLKKSDSFQYSLGLFNQFSQVDKYKSLKDFFKPLFDLFSTKGVFIPYWNLKEFFGQIKKVKRKDDNVSMKNFMQYSNKKIDDGHILKSYEQYVPMPGGHGLFQAENRLYYIVNFGTYAADEYLGVFVLVLKQKRVEIKYELLEYLTKLISYSFNQIKLSNNEKKLTSLVHCDDVTGLFNQRKLKIDLDDFIDHYKKNGNGFSVIFIDIDYFKKVNDSFGHVTGGLVLVEMGKLIQRVIRESDHIYRYGGDEFVVLLPGVDAMLAKTVGERLLKGVKKKSFRNDKGEKLSLSVSVGVAHFPTHAQSSDEVIQVADEMMYQAKRTGRGRVCMVSEIFDKAS